MDYVAPIDILSTVMFGVAIVYLSRARSPIFDRPSKTFLLLSLGIYFMVGMFNILQHVGITNYLDRFEDYLEILFITFFLFFIYSVNINIDMLKRKRVEQALRESEQQYRTLVEAVPYGILELDTHGTITFSNSAYARLHGYDRQELHGKSIYEFSPAGEEREKMREQVFNLVAERPAPMPWFGRDRRKDGSFIDVRVDWDYKRDNHGGITGYVALISDITERRRAEEDLKLFHGLLQRSNDAIYVVDPHTAGIIEVNEKASKDLGYSREELLAMKVTEFGVNFSKDETWAEQVEELRNKGHLLFNGEYRRKDGSFFPVEVNVSYIDMGKRGYMLAIVRDISERKKIEEEMLRAQKLESLGILAGGLAHDFNNLLTAILGNISIAKMRIGEDERAVSRLEDAEKASLRAKDLTQQLITFAKGGEPVKKVTSIGRIIQESIQFSLSGTSVKCECETARGIWPVEVDEGQISQVLSNLLINAVQAMPKGGNVRIRCENVTGGSEPVIAFRRGEFVKVTVRDEGVGIPHDYLPHIFDPYYTTKQTGSGLGLATAYSIIKRHDGEMTVDSDIGKGSTFSFYIPAVHEKEHSSKDQMAQPIKGGGRILVMDDEKQVREILREMLEMLGYAVETSRDGEVAVEMYRDARDSGRPFDAVVLDLTVPGGMGGEDTLNTLRQIDPGVRAIVSSGYSNDPIMSNYSAFGFKGVVAKPFTVHELSRVLHEAIYS